MALLLLLRVSNPDRIRAGLHQKTLLLNAFLLEGIGSSELWLVQTVVAFATIVSHAVNALPTASTFSAAIRVTIGSSICREDCRYWTLGNRSNNRALLHVFQP